MHYKVLLTDRAESDIDSAFCGFASSDKRSSGPRELTRFLTTDFTDISDQAGRFESAVSVESV
jgi:hypothetical protein